LVFSNEKASSRYLIQNALSVEKAEVLAAQETEAACGAGSALGCTRLTTTCTQELKYHGPHWRASLQNINQPQRAALIALQLPLAL